MTKESPSLILMVQNINGHDNNETIFTESPITIYRSGQKEAYSYETVSFLYYHVSLSLYHLFVYNCEPTSPTPARRVSGSPEP